MPAMRRVLATAFAMAASLASYPASAQGLTEISVSRVNLPGAITAIVDVLKSQGIDRKHGFNLEVKNFSTVAGLYAATASGEVDISAAGPWVLVRMRNEGARIKGVFTFVGISSLGVITADPNLRTIEDLKGKTIAADMASAEYLLLATYGKARGLQFGKDVTVVQASPPLARAQLDAGRVDAAMSWETNATLILQSNPKYRRMIGGETAWAGISKAKGGGWQLVLTMHENAIKAHKDDIPRLMRMWQDAASFMVTNTAEAEKVVEASVKLPPGVLKEALGSKRLVYQVLPVWEGEKAGLMENFKLGVDQGFIKQMPDAGVLYDPKG